CYFFDNELRKVDPFAGIAVARAGIVVDVQLVIVLKSTKVGESSLCGRADAQRQLRGARVPLEVSVRSEVAEGLSEVLPGRAAGVDAGTLDEAHDEPILKRATAG